MIIRTTFVALVSLSGAMAALGQTSTTAGPAPTTTATTPSWTATVTPSFASQYMFRGARFGGPSFEPSVEYDAGNLALGAWSNFPILDKVPGQSNPEIDPYGSYKFTINGSFNIQPGFTWYNYPNGDESAGFYKLTFEPNLAVNYTVSGVTFTPKIYYDAVLHGPTAELNAAYAVPLKDLGTEIDLTATVGTLKWSRASAIHRPDETKNWGNYWLIGAAVPYQLGKNSKLTFGWAYTKGTSNYFKTGSAPKSVNSAAMGRGVATVSYAWTI